MTPAVRDIILNAPFDPTRLPGNAARYSLDGGASDSTYLIDGSNRLMLVADRSGNSGSNALLLNAVSGNYAWAPSAAANQPGDNFEIIIRAAAVDWTPSAENVLCGKRSAGGAATTTFQVSLATNGTINVIVSDGTTNINTFSSVATGFTDLAVGRLKITYQRNTGAGQYAVTFYTSPDGVTWTQLGTTSTGASNGATRAGTEVLEIGSTVTGTNGVFNGRIEYFSLAKSIGGVPTVIFDPSVAAKLASSFVSSTGETWTVVPSGDTGARISGARDLVQLTQTKQPIFSVAADGRNIATFDGSNDYMKAAPFSLSQPESVYFVGSQVTWTSTDNVFDGNSANSMVVGQRTSTPTLAMYAGTADAAANTDLAVGVRGVLSTIFNGASSSSRVNRNARVTGSPGTGAAGGFTVGSGGAGANPGNITWSDSLVRSVADASDRELQIIGFYMKKGGIA